MSAKRTASVLAALTLLAALFSAPTAQAAAAPHWSITSNVVPSHLIPGDDSGGMLYVVIATNTGSADATGVTLTDELPEGLTLYGGPFFRAFDESTRVYETCEYISSNVGTCTNGDVVHPGQRFAATFPVSVDAGLAGTTVTNHVTASGGGAAPVSATEQTPVTSDPATFGLQTAQTWLTDPSGAPATQAGSHPYGLHVGFHLNTNFEGYNSILGGQNNVAGAGLKNIHTQLPPGLVVNPRATPVRCTEAELQTPPNSNFYNGCPDAAAVGILHVTAVALGSSFLAGAFAFPIYNMVPAPGVAAEFASPLTPPGPIFFIHYRGGVDPAADYALTADLKNAPQFGGPLAFTVDLWGSPADPGHNYQRGFCATLDVVFLGESCPVAQTSDVPLLTAPSACAGQLTTILTADSWEEPGNFVSEAVPATDDFGSPIGITGCNALAFSPTLKARPTTNLSDSPTGLSVDLQVPQTESFSTLATSALKKTVVTLPPGLVVNPSGANGLGACSSAQIGLLTPIGQTPMHFSGEHPSCPDAAKIGTVEVDTPLLEDPLKGAAYIARPFDNPFGSLLAVYVVVDDPKTGIVVKLAGEVEPDPQTGRLTTTFDENPQLPFEDFKLEFFQGANAPLQTPDTCGAYSTTSELTPWSGNPPAAPHDDYSISAGPNGTTCAFTQAAEPNSPSFDAGTVSPVAASFTPFVLNLRREDGSQRFSTVTVSPPPGLVAKLAGTAECSEAALAAAEAKSGREEEASPSCPANSQVGTVSVAAGAGPAPYNAPGKVYLAPPYKGAPLSVAIVTPAVAGPFDLGTVVVRSALHIDPATARITAVSDPIPQILQGIPLNVRSARLRLDRSQFTVNGTSCDPMGISGQLLSGLGQAAPLFAPFQLGECEALPFKPKLSLALKGPTRRGSTPALIATLKAKPGEANIAQTQVKLPKAAFVAQDHLVNVCTRVQFAANQCPADSIYGRATATSPLLDYPLTGNVYLRTNPEHELPDVVVALKGPASQPIEIDVAGKTDSVKGALRNTFEAVPDAPVSSFRLELFGGKKSLIELSSGFCANRRASILMNAQSGKTYDTHPVVKGKCRKRRHRHRHRRAAG